MILRIPEPIYDGDASVPVEALDYLGRLSVVMDCILARRGGSPALLDTRLLNRGIWPGSSVARVWHRVLSAALVTGEMLHQTLAVCEPAGRQRDGLQFLLTVLRGELEKILGHRGPPSGLAYVVMRHDVEGVFRRLWDAWPRFRDDLRACILRHIRDDDPKDAHLVEGVVRACGLTPPCVSVVAARV